MKNKHGRQHFQFVSHTEPSSNNLRKEILYTPAPLHDMAPSSKKCRSPALGSDQGGWDRLCGPIMRRKLTQKRRRRKKIFTCFHRSAWSDQKGSSSKRTVPTRVDRNFLAPEGVYTYLHKISVHRRFERGGVDGNPVSGPKFFGGSIYTSSIKFRSTDDSKGGDGWKPSEWTEIFWREYIPPP